MPRSYDDDDGRTIADMNIEGMPWHDKRARGAAQPYVLSRLSERLRQTLSSVLAGLLAAGAIIGCFALFILFCTHVWLR